MRRTLDEVIENESIEHRPNKAVISEATALLNAFQLVSNDENLVYKEPHISIDYFEKGIVFEWFNKEIDLTVYINETEIYYIKSWGIFVTSEMDDGKIESEKDIIDLLKWLNKE